MRGMKILFLPLPLAHRRSSTASLHHPATRACGLPSDPDTRLRLLAEYLDQFENNPEAAPASKVAFQPLFSQPKRVVSTYPVGEDEEEEGEEGRGEGGSEKKKRHMVSLNWLLSEKQLPLEDELALGFLDNLLLGTPGAPLRKRLLESGLGEALVSSGLDTDLLQVRQGCAEGVPLRAKGSMYSGRTGLPCNVCPVLCALCQVPCARCPLQPPPPARIKGEAEEGWWGT